jgi:DNA-binding NtrC family response regulator
MPAPHVSERALELLVNHSWPGNIRELRNIVERFFILHEGRSISVSWLQEILAPGVMFRNAPEQPTARRLRNLKRQQLPEVLARHKGNKVAAARELGITRKTIYNWLQG